MLEIYGSCDDPEYGDSIFVRNISELFSGLCTCKWPECEMSTLMVTKSTP
jgi:hypothetical protein